jgi:hypothetical protein
MSESSRSAAWKRGSICGPASQTERSASSNGSFVMTSDSSPAHSNTRSTMASGVCAAKNARKASRSRDSTSSPSARSVSSSPSAAALTGE